MSDGDRTHFADDATLAYIKQLEAERDRYKAECERKTGCLQSAISFFRTAQDEGRQIDIGKWIRIFESCLRQSDKLALKGGGDE